jgi:type I restriction enzyme S subunit
MALNKVKLADCCIIKPPKSEAKKLIANDDLVSFVPMSNLGIDTPDLLLDADKKLSDVSGSYTYFKDNDVLLAKITPCFENGKLGVAKGLTNGIGFGSSEFIVFRSKGNVVPKYLYYFLLQQSFRDIGKSVMTGAVGHKRVPKDYIENSEISLPSPEIQKQIVAKLDQAFADIEKARLNAEHNLFNSKELFESYFQQVFNQSDDWHEKELGDVCNFLNGYAFKSKDAIDDSDTQLIRMGNLYQNQLSLHRKPSFYPSSYANEYEKFTLCEGDLIMSLTGTVDKEDYGYTVEIPPFEGHLLLNQRIVKFIEIDGTLIERRFLLRILRSRIFLDKLYETANGTRQANLSTVTMKKIKISVPSILRQKELITIFDNIEQEVKNLHDNYKLKMQALEELKQSILQKVFIGELA